MRVLLGTLAVLLLVTGMPLGAAQLEPGEDPLAEPPEYAIQVYLGEDGADLVIEPAELIVPPGARVTFEVTNVGATDHDFAFADPAPFEYADEDLRERQDGGEETLMTPLLSPGEAYNLTVFIPEDTAGSVAYFCSVPGHRDGGMEGTLAIGAAAEEEEVTDFGVDYLAYWVGIVSFIIVFIVLIGTFFFFRYGETKEAVDHRTGASITAAASGADLEGEMTPTEGEEGFLPDPSKVAILLSLIAIVLWALTEFTSIFGGA